MMHVTAAAFESQKKVLKFICWGPPCLTMSSNELAILEEFEQRFQRLESTVKMLIWTSCARTCQCFSPFLERSCNHWTSYLPESGNLRYCWENLSKSRGNYEVRPTFLPESHRDEGRDMWWPIFSHVYEQQEVENVDQHYDVTSVVWDGRSRSQQVFSLHVWNFSTWFPSMAKVLGDLNHHLVCSFTHDMQNALRVSLGIRILTLGFNARYVSVRRFKDLCGRLSFFQSVSTEPLSECKTPNVELCATNLHAKPSAEMLLFRGRLISKSFQKCSKNTCRKIARVVRLPVLFQTQNTTMASSRCVRNVVNS